MTFRPNAVYKYHPITMSSHKARQVERGSRELGRKKEKAYKWVKLEESCQSSKISCFQVIITYCLPPCS